MATANFSKTLKKFLVTSFAEVDRGAGQFQLAQIFERDEAPHPLN
jgi:hypothetical protein